MKPCLASITLTACALGCGSRTDDLAATPATEPPPPRPAPGIDLAGPIPPPDRHGPARAGAAAPAMIDLAADRAVVPVAVPRPPPGGSVGFTFAEDRPGWVARIPDQMQLPAVAYGAGKIYVSGGFESVSFYGLDAETGRIDWATTNLEDNGPTAAIYEDDRVLFNTLTRPRKQRPWERRASPPPVTAAPTA